MAKGSYRSKSVKTVTVTQVQQLVDAAGAGRMVVGVDVGKAKFVAAFRTRCDEVALTVSWKHPQETPEFVALVSQVRAETEVASEATGRYGDILVSQLRRAGIAIFNAHTKRVHDSAEAYDGVPSKHDGKDAAVISDLQWRGRTRPVRVASVQERHLQATVRVYLLFKDQHERNLNRLEAELARFWPELCQHVSLQTFTLATVLAKYGTPAAVAADAENARKLLHESSRNALGAATLDGIIASARATQGVEAIAAEVKMLQALAADTLRARRDMQEAEAEIRAAVQAHDSTRRQADLVGATSAGVLTAKSGDASTFAATAGYLKALGLNLTENSSGNSGQRGVHLSKRGAGLCRKYLYLAALRIIQTDPVVASWYRHQTQRPGAVKQKVLTALMRKLARALVHVGCGAVFDATKLFDTRCFVLHDLEALREFRNREKEMTPGRAPSKLKRAA